MNSNPPQSGLFFSKYIKKELTPFERLFEIFKELITHTSGDFDEAIEWLRALDKEYQLTDEEYTIDDFIEDLKQKITSDPNLNREEMDREKTMH